MSKKKYQILSIINHMSNIILPDPFIYTSLEDAVSDMQRRQAFFTSQKEPNKYMGVIKTLKDIQEIYENFNFLEGHTYFYIYEVEEVENG